MTFVRSEEDCSPQSSRGAAPWLGFVQNVAPPSLSRDRRIKMEQTNKLELNFVLSYTVLLSFSDMIKLKISFVVGASI